MTVSPSSKKGCQPSSDRLEAAFLGAQAGQWLPGMDSNHDSRLQRPLSYR